MGVCCDKSRSEFGQAVDLVLMVDVVWFEGSNEIDCTIENVKHAIGTSVSTMSG